MNTVTKTLLIFSLVCICLQEVHSLHCYSCDTDTEEEAGACLAGKGNDTLCDSWHDSCFTIISTLRLPNNGPQDRKVDNEEFTKASRGCANKKGLKRYPKISKRCEVEDIGGGGEQTSCVCFGNLCNSATPIQAGFSLLVTALVVKLFV